MTQTNTLPDTWLKPERVPTFSSGKITKVFPPNNVSFRCPNHWDRIPKNWSNPASKRELIISAFDCAESGINLINGVIVSTSSSETFGSSHGLYSIWQQHRVCAGRLSSILRLSEWPFTAKSISSMGDNLKTPDSNIKSCWPSSFQLNSEGAALYVGICFPGLLFLQGNPTIQANSCPFLYRIQPYRWATG